MTWIGYGLAVVLGSLAAGIVLAWVLALLGYPSATCGFENAGRRLMEWAKRRQIDERPIIESVREAWTSPPLKRVK